MWISHNRSPLKSSFWNKNSLNHTFPLKQTLLSDSYNLFSFESESACPPPISSSTPSYKHARTLLTSSTRPTLLALSANLFPPKSAVSLMPDLFCDPNFQSNRLTPTGTLPSVRLCSLHPACECASTHYSRFCTFLAIIFLFIRMLSTLVGKRRQFNMWVVFTTGKILMQLNPVHYLQHDS